MESETSICVRKPQVSPPRNFMKTNKWMIRLFGVGGVFGILSWLAASPTKAWFAGASMFAVAAGLTVFLVGVVAARRASESKRKAALT